MSDNELIKNLQERIEYQIEKKLDLFIENEKLKEENEKLKEENKSLIDIKNIWFDSHRLVAQERDKLLKEINEIKLELKEYR